MEASFARSILVDAPMAVVAVDGAGLIRSSNATAEALFGLCLADDRAVHISSLVPGLDMAEFHTGEGLERFNADSRSGGEGVRRRARRGGDDEGPFVDIQAARFSVRGEAFLTLFIQDVTAVVAAERSIQELRLQIIYNWRLNSLGEMASMVAHELNQPLSATLNFLEAARAILGRPEVDRDKVLQYLTSAETQAERASDVIRRLRTLMSRDTGFHARAELSEVVGEILPILNIHARELDADIAVRIGRDCQVTCDRVQIQQVILNLVRNALDAPPTGQRRRVAISGARTEAGCRILIEDNGPGAPPELAALLFDPMSSSKPGGMGLGLSICRTIVEAHNGSIDHGPSTLGGAGFVFTLNDRINNA